MPHLAITLGDPAGIGPEIILKALAAPRFRAADAPQITLVGDRQILQGTYQRLRQQGYGAADPGEWAVVDLPLPAPIRLGQGDAASGAASFAYLEWAIAATLAGQFDGMVTAPIAKSAWAAAGHLYPGQTELLAQAAGVKTPGMMFVARSPHNGWVLRSLLATVHIPLRQVPEVLTPELMEVKLGLLLDSLARDFGLMQPRIAIAGLNPHSGEQGQLGREEQDWLIPWLTQARLRFPQAELVGPVPPDTLWLSPGRAWVAPQPQTLAVQPADAYLALYHDQGLIPVKLLAFDQAVNTTIGLPFVRTSPDHGTAFDIAGSGKAEAHSFEAALDWASRLAQQRLKSAHFGV